MNGESILGILPTGTGKSLCYQIPALSNYFKTGSLTVVISPLQALMADQVAGLEKNGIAACVTVNGMLSVLEHKKALERICLGDAAIVIISPEQLRSVSVRKALRQRAIGMWVIDEAHCISKWGHDFRPDYRYIARFIKEYTEKNTPLAMQAPIMCLTATAKVDVVEDMVQFFKEKLNNDMLVVDGGAKRDNLQFYVIPTKKDEKQSLIYSLIRESLPDQDSGGAVVYCITKKETEEMTLYLQEKGLQVSFFHAGITPELKKNILEKFSNNQIQVIVATNAFGMGIDKSNIRLVLHASIPGSIENYLQEAGRAGRDRKSAKCILLYTPEDVDSQFGLSSRSKLTQRDINTILKMLRNIDRKTGHTGRVIITPGELLLEAEKTEIEHLQYDIDKNAKVAVSWLEEAGLLQREENYIQVYPSSLRITNIDEAKKKIDKSNLQQEYKDQLLDMVALIIETPSNESVSTDEIIIQTGLNPDRINQAMYDLERLGVCKNDTKIIAFVHYGVENSSKKRLTDSSLLEIAFIKMLQELEPDLEVGNRTKLHLRPVVSRLSQDGFNASTEKLVKILRILSSDGKSGKNTLNSIKLKQSGNDNMDPTFHIMINCPWSEIIERVSLRHNVCITLLDHFIKSLPDKLTGIDLMSETTIGELVASLASDLMFTNNKDDLMYYTENGMLWMHSMEILTLSKSQIIFRNAMTLHLNNEKRGFTQVNFDPVQKLYTEKTRQIHIMMLYAELAITAIADALRMVMDYFVMKRTEFINKWLPNKDAELERETTDESWKKIIESLSLVQKNIVAYDLKRKKSSNILVLAGPGSGKTRVLVHRIAYLLRVKRENPRGIIALAYNRHAAVEIRKRLNEMVGDDANGVTVMTCHALALRIAGISMQGSADKKDNEKYESLLKKAMSKATSLLKGDGLDDDDADIQRERILSGFNWIFVDEYQDIEKEQYDLISALAGRSISDENSKLTIFAVGDDDQNIYSFKGASIRFIRQFEEDYKSRPEYLTENYRSTANIINASNQVIQLVNDRMKVSHPITINRERKKELPGGEWQKVDVIGKGLVQILPSGDNIISQTVLVMAELQRLATMTDNWDWSKCAIIARNWEYLYPVRSYCEQNNIPVQMADENVNWFWRLRETQLLLNTLYNRKSKLLNAEMLRNIVAKQPDNRWNWMLLQVIDEYKIETNNTEQHESQFIDWLAEWCHEVKRRQQGLMLLTAHRAKGLEFDNVVILDGGWNRNSSNDDTDAVNRLYYVAMTRARKNLICAHTNQYHPILDKIKLGDSFVKRQPVIIDYNPIQYNDIYKTVELDKIDLSYPGRYYPGNSIHRHISAVSPGDELQIIDDDGKYFLLDRFSNKIGKMGQKFAILPGYKIDSVSAFAVLVRRKTDSEPLFIKYINNETWEIVLPEIKYKKLENEE